MTDEVADFAGRLRRLRVEAGLTITALAQKAGLAPATVAGLEYRLRRPSRGTLAKLRAALGVGPEALLSAPEATPRPRAHRRAAAEPGPAGQANGHRVPLAALAQQVRAEHRAAARGGAEELAHARRAGDLLLRAKEQVPHGGWLSWLRDRGRVNQRTAHAYMRVAQHWSSIEALAASGRLEGLTLWGVAALLSGTPRSIPGRGSLPGRTSGTPSPE
jgi:transcriptional regulator with XRE-family HTH domain